MFRTPLRLVENYTLGKQDFHDTFDAALRSLTEGIADERYGVGQIHKVCSQCKKGEDLMLETTKQACAWIESAIT